jgi:hypothetical protein
MHGKSHGNRAWNPSGQTCVSEKEYLKRGINQSDTKARWNEMHKHVARI